MRNKTICAFLIFVLCFFALSPSESIYAAGEERSTEQVMPENDGAGENDEQQIVSVGDTLSSLTERVVQLGGSEIDISANGLDYDGWLHLFNIDGIFVLCHFNEEEEVDMLAVYKEGALVHSEGTKPVNMDVYTVFDPEKNRFPKNVGYWGENFSEDEYVYFTDTLNVIIYDTMENTVRSVPLI